MNLCRRFVPHCRDVIVALIAWGSTATPASTATTTDTFNVQIIIVAECTIQSASDLDFGSSGVLAAAIDATTTIDVQCTDTTPYNIGLDAGTGSGATVATRLMTGGGVSTVSYGLYRDAGRSQIWGESIGTNTVSAAGNGAVQSHTVFGRVPAQVTPAPDTYSDTITITVTY